MLRVSNIVKRFGKVVANHGVSLELAAGEVLGVLGENGAGKSTLMHILSGLIAPDSGDIAVDGKVVRFASPRDAARAGIGMVHQHFRLADALSVEDNLLLGDACGGSFRRRRSELRREARAITASLGIELALDAPVSSLGVAEQQRVEIIKTLLREPQILILDEPTAVLPPDAREGLFDMVRSLSAAGKAVLLISHRLDDIASCCDRVMVMKGGKVMATVSVAETPPGEWVRLMFGAAPEPQPVLRDLPTDPMRARAPVVIAEDLHVAGRPGVRGASFQLHAGEILGLCGVDGNGQGDLIKCLAGLLPPSSGRLSYRLGGQDRTGPLSAALLRRKGMAHIPEDRLRHGVIATASLEANWRLTTLDCGAGRVRSKARAAVDSAIIAYEVKARAADQAMAALSGGNQQKLVVARELSTSPSIILAAHPTRGVDLRTAAAISARLGEARSRGAGIIVLSGDLDELWSIADRIMVMADGRLRGPFDVASVSLAEVGHWMTAS